MARLGIRLVGVFAALIVVLWVLLYGLHAF